MTDTTLLVWLIPVATVIFGLAIGIDIGRDADGAIDIDIYFFPIVMFSIGALIASLMILLLS